MRRRKRVSWHRDLSLRSQSPWDDQQEYVTLSVPTYLPRPIALRARREIYPYPLPLQLQKKRRVVRRTLFSKKDLVPVRVRIRVPKKLPLASGSYVSIRGNRLNIHSYRQYQAALAAGELNRKRRDERKHGKRKARHGQLDSPGATAFGSVAHALRRGRSISRIADAALVARAILKGGV